MAPRHTARPHRRAEAWLWTGPAGHLVGGALDLVEALSRHLLARLTRGRGPGAQ